VTALWQAAGMRIVTMDAAHHDLVLAMTSHLPHLIAYTIVGTATDLGGHAQVRGDQVLRRRLPDFTRIAASDPVMWRDVFLNNREAVLEMLQRFSEDLTALQRRDPLGRGAEARGPVLAHPCDPPLHHRGEAGVSFAGAFVHIRSAR